ncbi:MAG: ferredoxin-NADP reductase [Thermoanaerobaculia bacterium]|nr:MAG: ferredoxin-NADP reductase [Thermoanaerobaculia bacterium]
MSEAVRHLEEEYATETRFRAVVVSSERITPEASSEEVRELVLDVERPDFPFLVGQSIGVLAPAPKEFGKEHHYRLYSVADLPERGESGRPRIKIAVRRCSYVDDYSGERFPGIASNYLCDRRPGDAITVTGPFGLAFQVPEEKDADLILIGSGTGIAPFRALVKHLFREVPDWRGRVRLFYGARSGLELLYMNDLRDDFAQYYDQETFEAFKALSPRPSWADPIAWDLAIEARGEELWDLLGKPTTYVYLAGLEKMRDELDKVFSRLAGSPEKWRRRKAELEAGGRWVELLY